MYAVSIILLVFIFHDLKQDSVSKIIQQNELGIVKFGTHPNCANAQN